jgi:hypothetical protein
MREGLRILVGQLVERRKYEGDFGTIYAYRLLGELIDKLAALASSGAAPLESRIQRGLEAGALLGPEWDGASLVELAREIVRLRAALASSGAASTASPASPWQPISTAPRDGSLILCCEDGAPFGYEIPHYTVAYWTISHRYYAGGFWQDVYRDLVVQPTHWMPLPDPPAASVGDPQTERE